jgi:hypothetical protein
MTRQIEQLELEVEQARAELASSLEELRARLTFGRMVEEAVGYARQSPAAELARNLSRDIQANPLPLIVIFAGIVWAGIAYALRSKSTIPEKGIAAKRDEALPPQPDLFVGQEQWNVARLPAEQNVEWVPEQVE